MTRDPRDLWSAVVARIYGIRPWEMGDLTLEEWESITDDAKELTKG